MVKHGTVLACLCHSAIMMSGTNKHDWQPVVGIVMKCGVFKCIHCKLAHGLKWIGSSVDGLFKEEKSREYILFEVSKRDSVCLIRK